MKTTFEEFDAFLSQPFDDVRWWEAESETADEMMESFQDSDWRDLDQTWPQRPPAWIERLIFTLPNGATVERTVPLVAAILKTCETRSLGPVARTLAGFSDAQLRSAVDGASAARFAAWDIKGSVYRPEIEQVLDRLQ